ncbi:hypothetical protein HAX54_046683, partial [Datura stramonium]|nr:hypothetical protein [Datura stramonium]
LELTKLTAQLFALKLKLKILSQIHQKYTYIEVDWGSVPTRDFEKWKREEFGCAA